MPRVNRDLQRRMAARRERERRRPGGERRYRFATPESEDAVLEQDGEVTGLDEETPEGSSTSARAANLAPTPSTRGGLRAAAKPFSAYKDEYAYVGGDLRRVAAVIGGLLVALVILYFLLPILVH